ncbi:MAG: hypothetical protein QOJ26_1071 [Thermoplasmata archaeon]|jgi:hypothetical protein|nr:hypothetical protein [Thermoplasmata archaeon]MEA3166202.1 hypothetical protein [Thermoplasmata archaeon]
MLLQPAELLQLADVLAALPFLPRGKGSLILILGGLAILPAALLLSRASSGTQRWVAGLEQTAVGLGLGPCRVLAADLHKCVVLLTACPTCTGSGRGRGSHGGPCVREQQALQLAIGPRAPGSRVVEIACNKAGRGACSFVIHRGRSS